MRKSKSFDGDIVKASLNRAFSACE
jgi:hypothetical protein